MTIDLDPTTNPYLQGNLAPVLDELDVGDLAITGELPAGLRGVFLRNGPNPQFAPLGSYHLFDGDGMIHSIEIADGRAHYRNRWVQSRGLVAERRAARALFGGLSQFVMPDPEVIAEAGIMKNTANTNIIRHAGRYLALMEAAPPTEVTRELETLGEYDYDGALAGSMTAHPKWDPATGELLFFGYSPFPPYLRYHVADARGRLVRSVDVDIPAPVMMHDFVVTKHNVVFFDLPAVFDINAAFAGGPMISWKPENGARIGVMPRDGGNADIVWIEVDPFYVFHFLNAWDADDSCVIVTGCRTERLGVAFGDEVLDEPQVPTLHRWTIDTVNATVKTEQLDDRGGEFPRINMGRSGTSNRYGYLATGDEWRFEVVQFNGFTKYDLEAGTSDVHDYGDSCEAGEPVFAADPEGTSEDDGWILNYVHDKRDGTTQVHVVDAREVGGEPVARIHLPRRVPFGFHGNWMPDHG